jgi:hypothetical protein
MPFRIHKYQVTEPAYPVIKFIPEDSVILSVQTQNGWITFWALVDESRSLEERRFYILPTGGIIADDLIPRLKFIDTIQDSFGLVFHVFEEKK